MEKLYFRRFSANYYSTSSYCHSSFRFRCLTRYRYDSITFMLILK